MALIDKLIAIANGFRSSRGTTDKLSLDEMATLAAEPMGSESKLPQVVDKTVTEITAEDLEGATKIGSYAFRDCTRLTSVTIPDSVTSISNVAFWDCTSLTSITIPDSVMSIGSDAFYGCRRLTSIDIPDSVTSIDAQTFSNCTSLTNVTIGKGVTSIGSSAFWGCTRLTSVTIGNGVESIGQYALCIGSSTNKATITFLRTTPPSIAKSTFETSKLEKIIVPAGCGEAYKSATNWADFADYIEEATA